MADVNSNININFNTAAALAQLRSLQAGLSRFHQSLAEGNLAAANAQKGLNAQLLQSIGATGKFSASQVKVAGSTLAFTSALEKNKLSLREYYRYTMAAATANTRVMGKAFAQEREIINRARRDRVKALQAQYIQMNKSNAGFMDAIRVMPKSLAMASGKFTELGTRIQYAAQRQQFLNQLLKQGSTQLLNFGKNTQWAGRQLMVGLTMPLALFGASAAKTFRELETEIIKFRRVYGNAFTNDAETDAAVENIRKLATEYTKYGVSVTKTMEMAATAAAAGFTGSALNAQVETATKLAVLGQVEQQQALETTISLQSAFGLSSEELAKKIDFLNAVENQTLLSIEDLTIAIPKAAPVVKQLGGSVEDLAFFLTAMKEGGINASEGANALKSGLASLINPSDKAAKFLGNLGINIKAIVEGNSGDIKATVVGFAEALDTLDPLSRARAIEQMFGKFQFSRLSTLFQNVTKDGSQASRAFDLAGASLEELAVLSEREMKKIEDAVGVKFQAAVEQFKQDIMPLGKIFLEALTPVVKFFGSLFEKFNGLSDNTKKVIAVVVGAVAGLGPIILMTFGLLANGIANVIKFFAMLRGGIARLNGQTSVMGAGFNYMTQEQIENAASSQQLHQTHTKLIEIFNVEANSVNALASSYNSLSTQMRSMASQNPALFAGGMAGAKSSVSKLPPVRKYKDGILTVPGPKGAGDIQPAMLAPGEAVIPAKTTDKYRGLISAMFNDKVPGFMAGRIPAGRAMYSTNDLIMQKVKRPAYPGTHPERQSGSKFVGMPKSFEETSQSRQILEKISNGVKSSSYGTMPPSDFGTLLQSFSGRSFPARGVGGIYRKPNGELVVVKPTIDEKTALAEVRATQIAREVHGLVSPKQSIRTMMDPTDSTGQRKFIVIESPYDSRIASTSGKFSKSDMVKQLVASTLRGDRDLQKPNLSGNVLADVGTAGVFDRASGFRDFAKTMPSMEQQAIINLLGVKGGAKKFFAQETSGIAAGMTPAQYDAAIKAEIKQSIPRLERVIKSFDLNPEEQVVYGNMLKRLRTGAKTNWAALQPMHARAGDGVIKAVDGVDPEASSNEIKEQLNKYVAKKDKSQIEKDIKKFIKQMDDKYSKHIDPTKKAKYLKNKSRYHDLIKQFQFDPDTQAFRLARTQDGSLTRPFTLEEARSELEYSMGEATKNGQLTNRKPTASTFRRGLEGFGKASTGSPSYVKTALRNLGKENPSGETLKMKKVMDDLKIKHNLSDKQLSKALRYEAAHIVPSGFKSNDPRNWQNGQVFSEFGIANNFLNTVKDPKSFQKLIDNPKTKLPVSQGGLGYTDTKIAQLNKDLSWASSNKHPTTPTEFAKLVRLAEFNTLAAEGKMLSASQMKAVYQAEAVVELGKIRKQNGFFDNFHKRVVGLTANNQVIKYGSEKEYLDAQKAYAQNKKQVLVEPGNESKVTVNQKTGKVKKERLTNANTSAKPANAVASSGSQRDSRATSLGSNQTVGTRKQIRNFPGIRTAFPPFNMPGMVDGDPRLDQASLTPYQKQELKRIATKNPEMSESQLRDILRRKLKADQKILKAKEKEGAAAEKVAKRAELLPKQEAARQAKLDKIENERQSRLLQASKDQEKAIKMNAKIDKQRTTQQAKMIRQEKVGRFSGGASMALGMAGSAAMMSGNMGVGMGLMGASTVAGMGQMFAKMGPIGWVTTAAVAVGGGLYLLNKNLENAAKKQAKYVDSISATTDKMDEVGQITNKVGASRAMDEVRKKGVFGAYNDVERAGTSFGDTFLRSEVGKSMSAGFVDQMRISGSATAAQDFALQLASYVSDGVLDASQAADIADQIGVQLGSRKYTAEILGNLRSIIGPNGEDLAKDPLRVRTRIVEQANRRSDKIVNSGNIGRTEAAQLGALAVNNLSIAKAQADATEFQYKKQIQLLEKELESTTNAEKILSIKKKIAILESKQAKDVSATNKSYSDQIDKEVNRFKKDIQDTTDRGGLLNPDANREDAYFDALKSKVKDVYKGTEFETSATKSLERLAQVGDKTVNPFDGGRTKGGFANTAVAQEFEVKMSLLLANKVLNPEQLDTFMNMFQGNLPELSETLSIGIKTHGAGATTEMLDYFSGFDDSATAGGGKIRKLAVQVVRSNPKEFKEIGEALAVLRALDGHEINMQTYIQTVGYDRLLTLSKDLAKIEAMPKKVDKELILKYFTVGEGLGTAGATKENLETLFAQWKDFDKLPDRAQKEAVSKFVAIYSTLFTDYASRKKFAEEERDYMPDIPGLGSEANKALADKRYQDIMKGSLKDAQQREMDRIAKDVYYAIGENGEFASVIPTNTTKKTGGVKADPLAFLAPLAMGLKQVRDGAFDALTPMKSLLQALTDKETQTGAFAIFDGIQDRLSNSLIVGQAFKDAINSLSATEFAAIANLPLEEALFLFEEGKPRSKANITAMTERGVAADEGYEAERLGRRTRSVKDKITLSNEDFAMYKDMPKLVLAMKDAEYSTDQINAVLSDPELAKFIVDNLIEGKVNAEFIADFLNNIEEKKIIDIQVQLNKGDLADLAGPGQRLVEDFFAAREDMLNFGADAKKIFENGLKIDALDLEIAPFADFIKKISEEVNDLTRELEMNPLFGDRAIQTIQDENSVLSNDLTVISKAAEEINKKYDDQAEALQKVSDINEDILNQQKRQIDLADAITSGDISAAARAVQEIRAANAARFADAQSKALQQARENELGALTGPKSGLTQDQISKKQYENSQKIYAMETNPARVKILKDIQDKQDKIYDIEENSIERLQFKIDELTLSNTLLQGAIDKEIANIKFLNDTKFAWQAINAEIALYNAARNLKENPKDIGAYLAAAGKADSSSSTTQQTIDDFSKKIAKDVLAKFLEDNAALVLKQEEDAKIAAAAAAAAAAEAADKAKKAELKKISDQYYADLDSGQTYGESAKYVPSGFAHSLNNPIYKQYGGMVPKYFAAGGYSRGTDTVPAMLTPGEFVMSKYAVDTFGVGNMKALNSGSAIGDSVYNYNLNLNVKSDANPDEIARAVMVQIKSVDAQRIRGTRI